MIACVDCRTCLVWVECQALCEAVERQLPSMETGRVDMEDIERLIAGKTMTNLILDNESILTTRQQIIVRLYYRESLMEREIGERLAITQQAVSDCLRAVKEGVWKMIRKRMAASRAVVAN